MLNKYVIKFTKTGYIKYISHLDLLRLFKRVFKKTHIDLRYSQGFNPHPKMSFAQPLSLGYSSVCEYIEIETLKHFDTSELLDILNSGMPEGIKCIEAIELPDEAKSVSGETVSAKYRIFIPKEGFTEEDLRNLIEGYISQNEIISLKRMKKTKQMEPVNIKNMIRSVKGIPTLDAVILDINVDCGSKSNLSPELVITSFLEYAKIEIDRSEIEVERTEINFLHDLKF